MPKVILTQDQLALIDPDNCRALLHRYVSTKLGAYPLPLLGSSPAETKANVLSVVGDRIYIGMFMGHTKPVTKVCVLGDLIVSGSDDNSLRI